jgi:hypothetical protein
MLDPMEKNDAVSRHPDQAFAQIEHHYYRQQDEFIVHPRRNSAQDKARLTLARVEIFAPAAERELLNAGADRSNPHDHKFPSLFQEQD